MDQESTNTILIVDDDSHFRAVLQKYLQELGYVCPSAADADSALKIIQENPPDMVLADIIMPAMDGLQLMVEAKRINPDIDFIIMTGDVYEYTYTNIINAGAADYMTKPFELVELKTRIDRVGREKKMLTELKETVTLAEKLTRKAETASRAKSELLTSISHEIRTPLNSIIGFTNLLVDTELNGEQFDYAKTVKMSAEVLLLLINDILDTSRIEAGQMKLENVEFDPEALCYDVCDIISPLVNHNSIEVLCRTGDTVPAKICGDPYRFRQLLINMMGNSAKFTSSGEIELSLDVKSETDTRIELIAAVRDTGGGIPEEKIEKIFEPFQRDEEFSAKSYEGTGLGLSICRKIAGFMGGRMWAESDPGKGSTFYFTALMDKAADSTVKAFNSAELSNKTILIVESNPISMHNYTSMLKAVNMKITAVEKGGDALPAITSGQSSDNPFDVCIIDINMAGMDGYELAKQIQAASSKTARPPLLAFSAPTPGNTKKCREAGFDGFLPKPVSRNKLFRMLTRLTNGEQKENAKQILTQYSC